MAIKEFIIGPQNYFEPGYFNGDYTHPNVSKSFLECDVDNFKGGRVVTGEYYLDNYIDGTYYHNNSMSFNMIADAMVVQEATVSLQGYYTEGYYTNGYYEQRGSQFFLTAELEQVGEDVFATGNWSSQANIEIIVSKTVNAISNMSVAFVQVALGARDRDIDLFAFNEAAIAVQIQVTRSANIAVTSVFDIATDGRRFRDIASAEDALFDFDAIIERSRDFDIETQAAFSFNAIVDKFRLFGSSLISNLSLTASISHIEGTDIIVNGFANVSAQLTNVSKETSAILQNTVSTLTINAGKLKTVDAQFITGSSVFVSRNPRRRTAIQIDGSPVIVNTVSKFGSSSNRLLNIPTRTLSYPNDIRTYITETFVFEGWYLATFTSGPLLFCGAGTGISDTNVGDNQWAVNALQFNINQAIRFRFTLLTRNSSNQTVKFDSIDYSQDTLPFIKKPFTNEFDGNAWNYFAVTKNTNNLIRFYINDTIVASGTISSLGTSSAYRIGIDGRKSPAFAYWDEISFRKGTSSLTTTAQTNQPDEQVLLFHFEELATQVPVDDTNIPAITHIGQASLVSTVTVTAQANANTKLAVAGLTSTATVAVSGGKLQQVISTQNSAFSQTALIDRFRQFQSNLQSTATVTAIIGTRKQFNITAGALFDPSIDADAQLAGVALLESQFTQSATAVKTTDVVNNMAATTNVVIGLSKFVGYTSTQSSTISISADVTRIRPADISIAGQSTLDIIFVKVQQQTINIESTVSISVDTIKFRQFGSNSQTQFNISVAAVKTVDLDSDHASEFTVNIDNVRIRYFSITANSQLSMNAGPVKTITANSALTSEFTQTIAVNFVAENQIALGSLFAPQVNADVDFAGFALLESQAALSLTVTRIRKGQFATLASTGLDNSGVIPAPVNFSGQGIQDGFTISVWVKRDSTSSGYRTSILRKPNLFQISGVGQVLEFVDGTFDISTGGAGTFTNAVRVSYPWDADEGFPYWQNSVPVDTDWHHYLLRHTTEIVGLGTVRTWQLWVDGELKTQNSPFPLNNVGLFYDGSAFVGAGDGGVAQIWAGVVSDSQFSVDKFYDQGFVDLGPLGRGVIENLPTPEIYNLLTDPWTNVSNDSDTPASQPLYYPAVRSEFDLTAQPQVVLVFDQDLTVTFTQTTQISYEISQRCDITSTATLSVDPTQQIGILANLTATATLALAISQTKGYFSNLNVQSTALIILGFVEQGSSNISSQFTLDASVDVKPPVRTEAFLLSTATMTVNIASFTDSITLMVSAGTLVADATVIPPIRIEAQLVAQSTLTVIIGSIEQFAVLTASSGTMTVNAVKRVGAVANILSVFGQTTVGFKYTGIGSTTLQVQGFQLTVGDVINLDPALTYVIPQETREYLILPENRVYEITGESRELIILRG